MDPIINIIPLEIFYGIFEFIGIENFQTFQHLFLVSKRLNEATIAYLRAIHLFDISKYKETSRERKGTSWAIIILMNKNILSGHLGHRLIPHIKFGNEFLVRALANKGYNNMEFLPNYCLHGRCAMVRNGIAEQEMWFINGKLMFHKMYNVIVNGRSRLRGSLILCVTFTDYFSLCKYDKGKIFAISLFLI